MLSDEVVDGDEAYEFTWVGKKASIVEANRPIRKTLRPCKEKSVNWDNTENLYIEGDNLEVLKLLQESYLGSVKVIYIDPPYNTGNDFIYRDNFVQTLSQYEEESGEYDESGNKLFVNTHTNGRFHSDWCSMLYPRLMVARNLLAADGIIFISIDDNELFNTKKICDEVFGASAYINTIVIKTKESSGASGGGEDKKLKKNCEFVLCYSGSKFQKFNPIYKKKELSEYLDEMRKEGKSFKYTTVFTNLGTKTYYTTIKDGAGQDIKIYSHQGYTTESVSSLAKKMNLSEMEVFARYFDKICTTENAQTSIRTRVLNVTDKLDTLYSAEYLPVSGRNKGRLTTIYFIGRQKRLVSWFSNVCSMEKGTIYKKEKIGTLWTGLNWNNVSREGNIAFPNGKKSLDFITQLLRLVLSPDQEDIVLDFFSGSATTAHAVMALNSQDNGNRKFIMVQLPEKVDEDNFENICDLGIQRIKNAGNQISVTGADIDVGFRVFKLDDSNMKDVYYSADDYRQDLLGYMESNIKEDRTDLDLLFECLLEWGLPLSLPYISEEIDGCTVHTYNDGDLIACFDEKVPESVIKTIARRQPLRVVFRDSGFQDSSSKINVGEIFKLLAPDTRIKVI